MNFENTVNMGTMSVAGSVEMPSASAMSFLPGTLVTMCACEY
jgi:hypothetical protein